MQPPPLKELFDVERRADPAGSAMQGVAPGYDLTKGAIGHPMVLYRMGDQVRILELDAYMLPDQPTFEFYVRCPLCSARGHIDTQLHIIQNVHKTTEYDPQVEPPLWPGWSREQMHAAYLEMKGNLPPGMGGTISIEPFKCTFEETPELQRKFGLSRCTWHGAIDKNIARDV